MQRTDGSCPIGKDCMSSGCNDTTCMYSVLGNCEYKACCSASAMEDRGERMQAVCMFYHTDESAVRKSINDISMAVMLNSYFEFLFQKPLLDCKPREVEELRNSESRYYAWRKRTTPSFTRVLDTLDKILPNL